MNKETLKKAFRVWKKETRADYAITYADSYGDCSSCVNFALTNKYGSDSRGIWLKHWSHGMNASTDLENEKSVYIAHDITEAQAEAFYTVFSEHFRVFPVKYEPSECFQLFDKDTPIYKVSYYDSEMHKTFYNLYADYETANKCKNSFSLRPNIDSVTLEII